MKIILYALECFSFTAILLFACLANVLCHLEIKCILSNYFLILIVMIPYLYSQKHQKEQIH